jgi:hypothetical protein
MLSKLIVFGAGYVLGSKAGRERYNQIVAFAHEVAKRLDEFSNNGRLPVSDWWGDVSESRRGNPQSNV